METTERQVNIKTISGDVKSLTVPAAISVPDFKLRISQIFNVPVDKQRLICSGKLLKDEQSLADHVKEDGQTVHLMVRADQPGVQPEPQSSQPNPQPAPQQMPFQIDRLLTSMVQGLVPAAQIIAGGQGIPGSVNINFGQLFGGQNPPGSFPPAQSAPVFGSGVNPSTGPSSFTGSAGLAGSAEPAGPSGSSGPSASRPAPQPDSQSNPHRAQAHGHVHQGAGPHRHVEVSLPFDRVHNLGTIINEMHGGGASFPPPRMPLLPFQRNPMTLLGGFLHNYEFQLLRFLPFVSRASDLLQRESLMTDPNDRAQLQSLIQRVATGLNEITAATAPVAAMLSQLQIGQSPGQFNLRIGNMNISQEVRPGSSNPSSGGAQSSPPSNASGHILSNPVSVPNPSNPLNSANSANPVNASVPQPSGPGQEQPNPLANLLSGLLPGLIPGQAGPGFAGMPGMPAGQSGPVMQGGQGDMANPLGMFMQGGAPNLFSMMPMFSQILGGNDGMTLRDLINTLQMHDEEESLPMMDFFYNLRIPEVITLASGNWEPLERQRGAVKENLLRLMEGDSPEGRSRIVQILLNYIQRQYAVPAEFIEKLAPGFDPKAQISRMGEKWLTSLVNHVMDYSGTSFVDEFKKLIFLLVGNYASEMSQNMQGGMLTVQNMMQAQMSTALARMIPPEFAGIIQGLMGGMISGYLVSSNALYQDYLSTNRVQEEAKDSQSPAGSLLATWQASIERDQRLEIRPQAPFSRSYLSSDVFNQSTAAAPDLQHLFISTLNSSVAETGANLSAQDVPNEVVQEFIQNWGLAVTERIRTDSDFRSGRFEALDRLRK